MNEKNYSLEKQLLEIQNNPRLSKEIKQEFIRFLKLHFFKKNNYNNFSQVSLERNSNNYN